MIADEARNSMTGHSTPALFTLHHRASHQERLGAGAGEGWGAGYVERSTKIPMCEGLCCFSAGGCTR